MTTVFKRGAVISNRAPFCDHVRHQWRGVDLPCATPGCVDGTDAHQIVFHDSPVPPTSPAEMLIDILSRFDTICLIRENWDGGWGWRLA